MDINFSELKQKEVINVSDGRHLGRVCDISFTFPEGKVIGVTVTGCKGFKFTKQEIFLPIKCIVKIGEDAVLVSFNENSPPQPNKGQPCCPPPQPNKAPPCCPPPPQSRRSLDEYE